MKRSGFIGGALALSALAIAACNGSGDDTSSPTPPKIDAGPQVDGSLSDDAGLDASLPVESGNDAGVVTEASAEGGPLDGGDAGGPSYALFVGTDFTNAELAVVGLHPDTVAGQLPLADQDSVPSASGGTGFVLERGIGKV